MEFLVSIGEIKNFDYHVLVHSFVIINHQKSLGASNLIDIMTDVHVLCWSPINTYKPIVWVHMYKSPYNFT